MKMHHSFWLWVFALWVLGLGIISGWRGLVLWQARALLAELGSTLSPAILVLSVVLFTLCALGLIASALGLWWRRKWGRRLARAFIPVYFTVIQSYTWLFVRAGLMWERRWISLILATLAVGIGVSALTWHKSRKWLNLD
jgi:hypothetical protein